MYKKISSMVSERFGPSRFKNCKTKLELFHQSRIVDNEKRKVLSRVVVLMDRNGELRCVESKRMPEVLKNIEEIAKDLR